MSALRFEDWTRRDDPDDVHARIFEGAVFVIRDEGVGDIVARVRSIAEETFGIDFPQNAENRMDAGSFKAAVKTARLSVDNDREVKALWHAVLSSRGLNLDDVFGDRLRLRIVPSHASHRGLRHQPLPAHRDSWGSGFEAQVNWWMPLYPLSSERTMVLWPDAFSMPIANSSGEWSLEAFKTAQAKGEAYPLLPAVDAEPGPSSAVPVLAQPGELLAFSSAHLHASRGDRSGISRFSLDTRTVRLSDIQSGAGAPNVDNAIRERQYAWFKRFSDGSGLDAAALTET